MGNDELPEGTGQHTVYPLLSQQSWDEYLKYSGWCADQRADRVYVCEIPVQGKKLRIYVYSGIHDGALRYADDSTV